jgi:hypothetical protein
LKTNLGLPSLPFAAFCQLNLGSVVTIELNNAFRKKERNAMQEWVGLK